MQSRRGFLSLAGSSILMMASLSPLLTGCEEATLEPGPGEGPSGGAGGQTGYVVGKVTDPQGKPLSRATIYVQHGVFSDNGPEVKSGSDGSYKAQLVGIGGQWTARGFLLKAYNDRVYKLLLDPDNPDSFTAEEKPVRNFQWKLTGHVPDLSLDLYYGGTAELIRDPNANGLWDDENIEFTFTPVGPLIDGSTGKVIRRQAKKRYTQFQKDIPIGRYEVTAVYKPTGEALLVCDPWDSRFNYRPSVTLDFIGTESATRSNQMGVGYTNRR